MKHCANSVAPKQNISFRKVVVTGGLGFIGSRVFKRIARMNTVEQAVVLDCVSYAADFRRLAPASEAGDLPVIRGDIRCEIDVAAALHEADAVIHLAAETHVPRSFSEPEHFFDVNVNGTETLLKGAQEAGVKHFIHISTDEVYGPVTDDVRENAPLRPTSPYAVSKAMAEEAVMMASQNGLKATILRPTNAIGTGQHPEKLFPRFVMRALQGQRLTIEGTGRQERTFLPVGDLAAAIGLILSNSGEDRLSIFNVSGEEDLSVLEVARRVFEVTGKNTGLHFVRDRTRNDAAYRIDDTKLRGLGYRQKSAVDQELKAIHAEFSARVRRQAGQSQAGAA
ncbi:NAD-dependent epimerase/dehydratase family protein [Roseibium sediminicola]|uniref:NAD-dependent epimerase/dehydratase family protein n=1 Tax=Roseibium sediminicola TaxID=2933272 RepID=A0ABT0GT57_9HYPH|nr:NAD-dependent epimerase/dehydratase family protein [Roseibium sp. CAU 1639]MCK7612614.1 NAD-dependent epimerase/dehydratase family protein [Roseibium sp. CAU 1639]